MAFAEYFDKNLQSAALLLQGIDAEAFKKTLEEEVVIVAVDDKALSSKEGRATIDLSVRLLARFFPAVAFVPLGKARSLELEPYKRLARSINSRINLDKNLSDGTHALVVGSTKLSPSKDNERLAVFYAGSDNWLARVSAKGPVGCGSGDNPFGAGASACVAIANIFRSAFKSQLPHAKPDVDVTFSTLQLAPINRKLPNPKLKQFDIGEIYLAGVGAIGNGFVWTMGRIPCSGTLHLVDGETLAQSNLQRYAMTVETDVGKRKVDLGKAWIPQNGLKVKPHAQHWEEFVGTHKTWTFDQVAVAVDTARTRINIQSSLPRVGFNSWTQAGEIGISRHQFDEKGACLACLYMPEKEAPNQDQLVARALRLPETRDQLVEIRVRLRLALPTDRAFLEKVSAAAGVPIEELLPFENKPLEVLYVEGICGGAVITLAKGDAQQRNEVPMAFQSALAGVLLAADLVAERLALRARLPTKTQINLMTALAPFPSNGQVKAKRCFCTNGDFLSVYEDKYRVRRRAALRRT